MLPRMVRAGGSTATTRLITMVRVSQRAVTCAQVAAIWKLDVPLRDKALWRMLYKTAACAEERPGSWHRGTGTPAGIRRYPAAAR